MPDVVNKSQQDAVAIITSTGIQSSNITINTAGPRTSDGNLFNKVLVFIVYYTSVYILRANDFCYESKKSLDTITYYNNYYKNMSMFEF